MNHDIDTLPYRPLLDEETSKRLALLHAMDDVIILIQAASIMRDNDTLAALAIEETARKIAEKAANDAR